MRLVQQYFYVVTGKLACLIGVLGSRINVLDKAGVFFFFVSHSKILTYFLPFRSLD